MLLHSFLDVLPPGIGCKVAVRDSQLELSYLDLERQSRNVASWLIENGCQVGDRVGLYIPKSVSAIAVLFGVLRCGAAYVPIDPTAPPVRAGTLLRESGAVICFSELAKLPELEGYECVVCSDHESILAARGELDLPDIEVDSMAAILFTSGSTGTPKGVMLSHRNILSFVSWAISRFSFTDADRFVSHAPLHFDLSTLDIFASLNVGGEVFLLDEMIKKFPSAIAQILEKQKITVWYSVPTALRFLCERAALGKRDLSSLRWVFFAGETFPIPALRNVMMEIPGAEFVNFYGPTETNVCTYHILPATPSIDSKDIPIGVPCEHIKINIVDEFDKEVDNGEMGEVVVSGEAVSPGYWNDDIKTECSRWNDQIDSYRTGDFGIRMNGGNIFFCGRKDHQIKIRGYRVELAEIENALLCHKNVYDVAVVLDYDEKMEPILVAHVVAEVGSLIDEDDLRDYCATLLPVYEVPGLFENHTSLPRTSTGKMDRKALTNRVGDR